jgi:hypothetical protein
MIPSRIVWKGKEAAMTQATATNRTELEARLIARAWQDDAFKQQLVDDPRAAIAAEFGRAVPEGIEMRVVEETATVRYLVLPPNTTRLSDEELDRTAGGFSEICGCST